MKQITKDSRIALLTLGFGGIGLALRYFLYAFGMDEKGLLLRNHPLHILCILLTLGYTAFAAATVWKRDGSNNYKENFPANQGSFAPAILAACGILTAVLTAEGRDTLTTLWRVLGILSAPALVFTGWCRIQGKRPSYLLHTVLCLFYATHLICRYRVWSGDPQLADYLWQLFACVFLTLTSYQHAAFDAGIGRRRMQLFCSLMAGYMGILSTVASDFPLLYLTGGCWALVNLCPLDPPARRHREGAEEEIP